MKMRPIWNPREMNVGNTGQPILTPAQLQQLTQLGLNPAQMGTLGLNNLSNNPAQSAQSTSNNVVNAINGPMVSAQTSVLQTQPIKVPQTQMQSVITNPTGIPILAQPAAIPSMPWPVSNPVCNVPYFDMNMYRGVNMEVMPSHDPSGMDLPLTDITTLRFFFNLGVQQSRNLLHSRSQQQALENIGALNSAAVLNIVNSGNVNQNAIDQLNTLIGQHTLLRQAQQIQAGPQHMQVLQQQLTNIMNPQRGQQIHPQIIQLQQQQQQNTHSHLLQQQLAALAQQQQQQHQAQQQQHQAQQQQAAVAAAAAAVVAQSQDRKLSQAELLALAAQSTPVPVISTATPINPISIMGTPTSIVAVSNSSSAPPVAPTPLAPVAQNPQKHFDSSLLFQQALLSSTGQGGRPNLHDVRLQAIAQHQQQQQQQHLQQPSQPAQHQQSSQSNVVTSQSVNLHPFIRPTEAVKQAAAANGGETSLSPRPIPVDPSPPRSSVGNSVDTPSDVAVSQAAAFLRKPKEEAGKQSGNSPINENDVKPSTSTAGPSVTPHSRQPTPYNPIGIANPMSVSSSTANVPKSTVETPASSQHIPSIIQMSEQHFTDTFQKSELNRKLNNPNGGQVKSSPKTNGNNIDQDEKPALAPILMMSYLNTCMSQAKTQLNANGLHVGMDDNGQIVDYSSRPIDPIFKDAREDLAKSRDYRNTGNRKRSLEGDKAQQAPQQPSSSTPTSTNSSSTVHTESSPKPASQNPLGINRAISDAAPVLTPKAESEQEPVINVTAPEDDSEDDGSSGKRLRIATDEE